MARTLLGEPLVFYRKLDGAIVALQDRFGQPEDTAWAAVYLASDASSGVTGGGLLHRWRRDSR